MIHTTSRNVGRHVDARRALGHLAALLLAPLLAPLTTLPAADRPNIVLILADDMGWRDAGCFGGKAAPTPHLDELAASGVKMTRFYAASAVCTPTRASILTGRHPLRFDIRAIFPDDESHLPRGTVTLPALLKAHGYGTAHVGKWHLGGLHAAHAKHRAASIPGPREHGFDHYLSQIEEEPPRRTMGRERRLYREGGTCLLRDDEPVPEDDPYFRMHLTDIIGAESIRLVEQFHREKKPFFLNIWHLVPHAPYEPGSEPSWTNTAARGISDDQHRFRSMMAHMDATIGALLRRLDELGLRENTLVIFTSDNGGAYESDLGPLAGGKTDLHEGGIRVPFIARWPGRIPAGAASGSAGHTSDLLPTLCAAAGVPVPAAARVDGVDLLGHWRDQTAVVRAGPLVWQLDLMPGIQRRHAKPEPHATEVAMDGTWKLLCRDAAPLALFDLDADLAETTNLLDAHPEIAARLARDVRTYLDAPRDSSGIARKDPVTAKPNVLFIIADDASCTFGAYGCRWAKTPAVDRLAREGIVFDNAYVPTSKCAPCRAAILTGRNPWQLEAAANHWPTFPPDTMAFTEVLAARGRACGGAGKVWGPGVAQTAAGNARTWGLAMQQRGQGKQPGDALREFLASRKPGQPFFYWYGSEHPHRPYGQDAGRAAGKQPADIDRVPACWPDTDVVRRDMLDYATEMEAFDADIRSLLAALEAAGEAENTLVIVTSDHGMPFPRIKGHTFDPAHRVPLVMRWPAGIVRPGRRVEAFVSAIDFAPTILALESVDGAAAGMRPITGTSLADLLADAPKRPRDRVILGRERNDVRCRPGTESGLGYPARAIRRGSLFYVHNFAPDRWPCGDPDLGLADTDAGPTKAAIEAAGADDRFWQLCFGKRPADELYDLATDPDCVTNLAADPARADDVRRLREELFAELTRQEDPRVLGRGEVFDDYPSPFSASSPRDAAKVQNLQRDFESPGQWRLTASGSARLSGRGATADEKADALRIEFQDYYQQATLGLREPVRVEPDTFYLLRYRVQVSGTTPAQLATRLISRDSRHPQDPPGRTSEEHGAIPASGREIAVMIKTRPTDDLLMPSLDFKSGPGAVVLDQISLTKTDISYYTYVAPVPEAYPSDAEVSKALKLLAQRPPAAAAVRELAGRTRLTVRGEPLPPLYVASFAAHSKRDEDYQVLDFKKAGVKVRDVHLNLGTMYWTGPDTYRFNRVEQAVMRVLGYDPDSFVILRVTVNPYESWAQAHPDEVMTTDDGKRFVCDRAYHCVGIGREPKARETYTPSYFSTRLREDTGAALRRLIQQIQKAPWGRAVIGYHLIGGSDATFRPPIEGDRLSDYSPAAAAAFRAWLTATYRSDEALEAAWSKPGVTLLSAPIPSEAARRKAPFFMSHAAHQNLIDYDRFYTEAIDDLVLSYARIVKAETKGRALAGIYYPQYDHLSLGSKILGAPEIDFVVCFEDGAGARGPGGAPGTPCAADSVALNKRLFFQELDIRTSRARPVPEHVPMCGRPETAAEYNALMIRDFGRMLVRGHGGYWFDMTGGWFNDPDIMDGIRRVYDVFRDDLTVTNAPHADLAVFVDEKSMGLVGSRRRRDLYVDLMKYQQQLNVSGVPYHFYLQQDIANPALPKYKAYLFLNAYQLAPAEAAAIQQLKDDPARTLVFLHAPGHGGAANDTQAAAAISELTGIQVRPSKTRTLIAEPLAGPMTRLFGQSCPVSLSSYSAPSFRVDDPSPAVTAIARYPGGGPEAAAVKLEPGRAKLLFSGAIELTPAFVNLVARWAGCWVAAKPGDGVYVNRDWLIVHAAADGVKEIRLAQPSSVTDCTDGKLLQARAETLTLTMQRGETRWFRLEPLP